MAAPDLVVKQCLAMGAASAVLGPLLDGMHSHYGVLTYNNPIDVCFGPGHCLLETSWMTPPLFALAGVVLGLSYPWLDERFSTEVPAGGRDPTWYFVINGIGCFVVQYWMSAVLESPLQESEVLAAPAIDVVLASIAVCHWKVFDGTKHGAAMAAVTAILGPLLEVFLIRMGMHTYSYPQILGVPTWIAWVYACGGPAVGNLGRKVKFALLRSQR